MATPVLKVEHLVQKIGFWSSSEIVKDISFEVHSGEIVALMGRNGTGKSTALDMLSGMKRPTRGKIFLYQEEDKNWEDVTRIPLYERAQKGLSYLPQKPSLFTKLTVRQNLLGMLELMNENDLKNSMEAYDPSLKSPEDFCDSILKKFELFEQANNESASLSGGQKRRLAIARALIRKTKLFVLDEPFNDLDRRGIEMCQETFCHVRDMGIAVLVVLHKAEEILEICDRVIFMHEGKILADDIPEKVVQDSLFQTEMLSKNTEQIVKMVQERKK